MTHLVDLDALPDVENLTAAAELYLATAELRSWTARVVKRLFAETEKAPIETIYGPLTRVFDKFEYPVEIADTIPSLGRNHYAFSLPMTVDHGRPLEILLESMPELETEIRRDWKVTTKVDGHAAAEAVKENTEEGKAVRRLRERKTKLGTPEQKTSS